MKLLIFAFLISTLSLQAEAVETKNIPKRSPSSQGPCQDLLRDLVKKTARNMGLKSEFAFDIAEPTDAGQDMMNRPLKSFGTSVFFIDEGFLSGSGASMTARVNKRSCEVVSLTVNIGG